MNLLCRKCCCCCYSDRKDVNPVTLTRAETITVQPTTSGTMQMTELTKEEKRITKAKSKDESTVSEFDEIDLEERLPTDDVEVQNNVTQKDQQFASAVTDMMLDEINDEESGKEIIGESADQIDLDAVIEATDEEVNNTLTRKVKEEHVDDVVGVRPLQEISERENDTPSPPKPPRQAIIHEVKSKNASESEMPSTDKELIILPKASEDELTTHDNSYLSIDSAKVCEIDDENTENDKNISVSNVSLRSNVINSIKNEEKAEIDESVKIKDELLMEEQKRNDSPVEILGKEKEIAEKPLKEHHDDGVDDETTASTDFEMKNTNMNVLEKEHEIEDKIEEDEESITEVPPPLPKNPPPETPDLALNRSTMYGDLSDEDSEFEESESESLAVPRKLPNRVSVKQTNVVITKVTAVDSPSVEEVSDLDSVRSTENTPHNKQKPKGYIVLTDEEFSEKII